MPAFESLIPHSRRSFLTRASMGLGGIALADMLGSGTAHAAFGDPLPGLPHFAPKAKRVIYLFMSGGLSQFESFDYKPTLNKRQGEELPDSLKKDKEILGMSKNQAALPLVGSKFAFAQHGKSGAWVSEQFPHTAKVVDDLCFIKSLYSEAVNHDPALTFLQTGAPLPARPSIGSWVTYGLGSENKDLPGYIAMVSNRPADQPLSSRLWDSGFMPTHYQGVQFRSGSDPVLYLSSPQGVSREGNRKMLDGLRVLHEQEKKVNPGAIEIASRIEQFEMAYRMQASVPDATDVDSEPENVLKLYGDDVKKPGTFARNCLTARRLAERGVRFIQLFHPGWDHHGALPDGYPKCTVEIDQGCAALITDLKQRDLLKDTLVIFASEFGRTCYSQGNIAKATGSYGREHHRDCFTVWMAGGGVKPGMSYGETDEFGYGIAEKPVHVNDFHATILHLLGVNHERLIFPFQGRDYRLTDVGGKVIKDVLA
jgi:hypothetical protein